MKRKGVLLAVFICVVSVLCMASQHMQAGNIASSPTAVKMTDNGASVSEGVTYAPGEAITGAAPMEIAFTSNVTSDKTNIRYEWQISDDSEFSNVVLVRYDTDMDYTFSSTTNNYIRLILTDSSTGETVTSDVFTVTLSESSLKAPNAFTPNNDGVNDVYKVTYNSLTSFHAAIFNRWGQKIFSWNNPDVGWDGSFHGKQVKDGVYFVVIEAVGSDKVKYNIKRDVNVLR
jgi:gliding motility-associated-like protein